MKPKRVLLRLALQEALELVLSDAGNVLGALGLACRIFENDDAWPHRDIFPLPLLVHKRVAVMDAGVFALRSALHRGVFTASGPTCGLRYHEAMDAHAGELPAGLLSFFERTSGRWKALVQAVRLFTNLKPDCSFPAGAPWTPDSLILDRRFASRHPQSSSPRYTRSWSSRIDARQTTGRCDFVFRRFWPARMRDAPARRALRRPPCGQVTLEFLEKMLLERRKALADSRGRPLVAYISSNRKLPYHPSEVLL